MAISEKSQLKIALWSVPAVVLALVGFGITLGVKAAELDETKALAKQNAETVAKLVTTVALQSQASAQQTKDISDLQQSAKDDRAESRANQSAILEELRRRR